MSGHLLEGRGLTSDLLVVSGDGCQSIASRYGISLANFIAWNSGVGQNCQSLWLDTYVCVGLI
jgi:hypothetical protein